MNLISAVEQGYMKEVSAFNVGDTVRVFVKVVEGDKERLQQFEAMSLQGTAAAREKPSW